MKTCFTPVFSTTLKKIMKARRIVLFAGLAAGLFATLFLAPAQAAVVVGVDTSTGPTFGAGAALDIRKSWPTVRRLNRLPPNTVNYPPSANNKVPFSPIADPA